MSLVRFRPWAFFQSPYIAVITSPRAESSRERSEQSIIAIPALGILSIPLHRRNYEPKGGIEPRAWRVAWWKGKATGELGYKRGTLWLPDFWDTRMRSDEHRAAKAEYMRNNPVRAGLVISAELWPFQGDLFTLR